MPRYDYRPLPPTPAAEKAFLEWIESLDREFMNRDPDHRSDVVRGRAAPALPGASHGGGRRPARAEAQTRSFDPRNATLEPEYYGDVDAAKYAEREAADLVLDDV